MKPDWFCSSRWFFRLLISMRILSVFPSSRPLAASLVPSCVPFSFVCLVVARSTPASSSCQLWSRITEWHAIRARLLHRPALLMSFPRHWSKSQSHSSQSSPINIPPFLIRKASTLSPPTPTHRLCYIVIAKFVFRLWVWLFLILPESGAATGGRPQLFMRHFEQASQVVASCLGEKKQLEKKREKMLTFSTVEMFISFTSVKCVSMLLS